MKDLVRVRSGEDVGGPAKSGLRCHSLGTVVNGTLVSSAVKWISSTRDTSGFYFVPIIQNALIISCVFGPGSRSLLVRSQIVNILRLSQLLKSVGVR